MRNRLRPLPPAISVTKCCPGAPPGGVHLGTQTGHSSSAGHEVAVRRLMRRGDTARHHHYATSPTRHCPTGITARPPSRSRILPRGLSPPGDANAGQACCHRRQVPVRACRATRHSRRRRAHPKPRRSSPDAPDHRISAALPQARNAAPAGHRHRKAVLLRPDEGETAVLPQIRSLLLQRGCAGSRTVPRLRVSRRIEVWSSTGLGAEANHAAITTPAPRRVNPRSRNECTDRNVKPIPHGAPRAISGHRRRTRKISRARRTGAGKLPTHSCSTMPHPNRLLFRE